MDVSLLAGFLASWLPWLDAVLATPCRIRLHSIYSVLVAGRFVLWTLDDGGGSCGSCGSGGSGGSPPRVGSVWRSVRPSRALGCPLRICVSVTGREGRGGARGEENSPPFQWWGGRDRSLIHDSHHSTPELHALGAALHSIIRVGRRTAGT
ncbi:hypothetical protein BZA05DRAFT_405601 [Tricharina praecox]|uniref:uncharacterized protein n=1 Tax=Tricharina praecox TaxID=43433 RepID=UPI0022204071|nr:uncharacterized protein BZA05DRAFT_405601 [Tricharina praecox]KAI5846833.1 hypothetical protein BZA05DRAFT_405601 [Tricharina praecox]